MQRQEVRVVYFSNWARGLRDAAAYLDDLPATDLRHRVSDPGNESLLQMARLDCDWDGECLRCFASLEHPGLDFAPALVADAQGLVEFCSSALFDHAQPWLVMIDQRPAAVAPVIGKLLTVFTRQGGRLLYYSYDDASRNMACHAREIAPHLSVLIHDEYPLAPAVASALPDRCQVEHSSWVANVVPFAYPFDEDPAPKIVFLGSKLGVTEHRRRQIRAMERRFKDRFCAITDHSVPVRDRGRFAAIKVHLCPEGRKFTTASMSRSHTDRPFWAGCMGQVPVSENSRQGDRLSDLVAANLVLAYDHEDTRSMIETCERALETDRNERRRIYEHFNRHGTVGPVVARRIATFHGVESEASVPVGTP